MNNTKIKEWWRELSVSFAGATLGIIITFGLSSYLDKQRQAETYHKLVVSVVQNLEQCVDYMDEECTFLMYEDTLIDRIDNYYPDSLKQMDKDSLGMFINVFLQQRLYRVDASVEGIFMNNIEVMENLDDLDLQLLIGRCYAGKDIFVEYYNDLRQDFPTIFRECIMYQKEFPDADVYQVGASILRLPEVYTFATKHHVWTANLIITKERLRKMVEEVKTRTNITDEELNNTFSGRESTNNNL